MAEISLRAYVKEIDDLVEHEQLDEAIAHARHILNTYPRHLDTYRLLGKAYLEAKRFGDSADIMQRVLSAVPDDFVAHVGMSIVREDEGNLEAAIWHMERAFETNPSNAAVQGELRRLIGRRDGLEPQKVRLTRGALARMYAHGELYPQAVAELRAALQEDPDRPDLQVLLAEIYWRTNQRAEAGQVATSITEALPNCRDANRILAAVLHAQGRTEEALTYHRRVAALDPYAALVESVRDDPATIDGNAVRIEKLAWRPGQPLGKDAGPPEWAAGLGAEARAAEAASASQAAMRPSWLDSMNAAAVAPVAASRLENEEPIEEPSADIPPAAATPPPSERAGGGIPEWMQAAGWAEGSGEVREGPISFSDDELRSLEAGMVPPEPAQEPEGGLARAQIPDWLKEVAPPAAAEELEEAEREFSPPAAAVPMTGLDEPMLPPGWVGPPPGTSEGEDDWLKPAAEEAPALPTWMEEQSPGATATIVTWLGDRGKGTAAERPPSAVPPAAVPPAPAAAEAAPARAELPEWLAEQAPTEQAPAAAAGSEGAGPAWLSGVAEAAARGSTITPEEVPWAGEPEGEPIQTGMYPEAEAPAQPGALPDWLQSIAGAESASGIRPRPETTPEWLAPEPVRQQPVPAAPKEPAGESFGWLRELAEAEPPTPGARDAQPAEPTPPSWLTGERAADSSRTALGQPAGPEWLRGIAEPEPASRADQEAASMDWLRDIAEPAPPQGTGAVAEAHAAGAPGPIGQDEATEWVNLVGAGEGQAQPTSTGEWLKLLKEDGVPPPEPPPVAAAAIASAVAPPSGELGDDQAFDWLEALAAKQSVPAPETLPSSEVSPPTRPAAPHVPRPAQPPEPAPVPVPAFERTEVPAPEEAEAGFDWLEEFVAAEESEGTVASTFEAPPAEPPTIEESLAPSTPMYEEPMAEGPTPTPEVPDWLKQLVAETPMAQPVPSESVEEPESLPSPSETWPALPAWMLATGPAEEGPTVPPLPPVRGPAPVEPALEPIDELAESWVPPWETMGVEEPSAAAPPAIDETIVRRPPVEPVIADEAEPEEAEPEPLKYQEPPTDVVEEVPDWLRTPAPYATAAEVAPSETEKAAEEEKEAEFDIPDWLMAPAASATAPPAAEAPPVAPPAVAPPEPVAVVAPPPAVAPPEPVAVVPPPPPVAPPVPIAVVPETPTPEPAVIPAAEVRRAEAVPPPLPPAAPAPKPPLRAPKPKAVKPGLEEKLREARHALAVGDYRRAAHDYTAVIKKKYQLDEVTSELELALDRNPKASDLWQALGDAYMRGDRLQDAIAAYERGVAVA